MALKRVQALQQRGPCAAPKEVQNPPAGAAEDQKSGIAYYTDQDRKILQLCGEDSAWAGPGGEAGSNLAGVAGPCGGRLLFGVGGA